MNLGAIDVIIAALKRFHKDKQVEKACLNTLAALSLFNRPVSVRVGNLGGVEMTADFWERNFDDPDSNVANYFGCYQDLVMENRERMRMAGAIRMMFEACGEGGRHFWDASAQFSVWCGFSSFHSIENYNEFRRLGGMRHTYVAFRDHAKSYRVREEILQAMKGICASRANREDLVKEGFFELLVSALKEQKRDPQVQALGLEVLRLFIDSNTTLRASLAEADGVSHVLDVLHIHSSQLLDTRASWDNQNVYGSMNDHMYNVPGAASEILYSLAKDAETRKAMLEALAIKRIEATIWAVQSRIEVVKVRTWFAACQTLRLLRNEAEDAGQEVELQRALRASSCPEWDQAPAYYTSDAIQFEP